jgi:ATP-binding cassette subfamily B protein
MRILNDITAGEPGRMKRPIGFTVLSNLINLIPFAVVIRVVHILFTAHAGDGSPLDTGKLWWIAAGLIAYMAAIFWGERLAYRACYRGAYAVSASGRTALAEHLRRLPLGYLHSRDSGDLANMIMGDFALIEHALSHFLPQLFGALVLPLLGLIGLAFLDWRMALALFAALPAAAGCMFLASRLVSVLGDRHQRAKIDAGNRLQEYLRGIRVIKAHNLIGSRFERLELSFRKLMRESILIEGAVGPVALLAIAFARVGLTVLVILGVYLMVGGSLAPLVFVTFLIIGVRLFDPLTAAMINFAELRYASRAGKRIRELRAQPVMTGSMPPPDRFDMSFEEVTFAYDDKPVLHDITATMPQGELTALVGHSGSGKSTMLRLAARFYDADRGTVRMGGRDLREMEPEALLQKISMVFQDVYLFQDTVRNNIAFGKRDATEEEIESAARRACCHDFISKLPQGYDSMVGEGGCTLSGGEKQRISIARAFLKDAPIVLLDEATAALDPENELEVQRAIDALIKDRTVLVVAHRLKTIRRADSILVFNDGCVVERGRHSELIARDGLYAKLWGLQQQSQGWRLRERHTGATLTDRDNPT